LRESPASSRAFFVERAPVRGTIAGGRSERRSRGTFSIFAMWMSDVHSAGGSIFDARLCFLGLTGWEILLAMVVGITIVYFLMNLIRRPPLKYGTSFPVVARMAFGVDRRPCAALCSTSVRAMKVGNFFGPRQRHRLCDHHGDRDRRDQESIRACSTRRHCNRSFARRCQRSDDEVRRLWSADRCGPSAHYSISL